MNDMDTFLNLKAVPIRNSIFFLYFYILYYKKQTIINEWQIILTVIVKYMANKSNMLIK